MEYLSIGKVSKIKNVSIKSLRYYDAIGILKPAYINVNTNYRYYTAEQLYLLDAIRLCIKLGIPLKNMKNYVTNDTINLQKLLYDSKTAAEQKIKDIYAGLEELQNTLSGLSLSAPGTARLVSPETGTVCPSSSYWEKREIFVPKRTILTVPLDEHATPRYYGQYILKLFVLAQQCGLTARYPSGVLYEYLNGNLQKYMFLHIEPASEIPKPAAQAVRYLEGRKCFHKYLAEHLETEAAAQFPSASPSKENFLILETDVMDSSLKEKGHFYELLLYPQK